MHTIPLNIGTIHFIGIGGIGMSGVAEIMHNLGYAVSGSDLSENDNVIRLRGLGIQIHKGHEAGNIDGKSVVVKSTAVKMDNAEIIAAREAGIPIVRRSEMLAEITRLKPTIAVTGCHGKTTTTSLIGHAIRSLDPTIINGGVLNSVGSNAKLGDGDWIVAEADESDGTFIKIPASVGIITNIDPEHLDYWGSFEALKEAYRQFIHQLPFYGFCIANIDCPNTRELVESINDRRVITYSINSCNDTGICADNIRSEGDYQVFDVHFGAITIKDIKLPMLGKHNVSNALAAICVHKEIVNDLQSLPDLFDGFNGVKRRFTLMGKAESGAIIVDDYAHHPVEIDATLSAAKSNAKGDVIAVMQPHRYSRLQNLWEDFAKCYDSADKIIITPIFAAGEQPLDGIDQQSYISEIHKNYPSLPLIACESDEELKELINKESAENDSLIFMGAGSITKLAKDCVA